MAEKFCCCNSGRTEDTCCGPYLAGQAIPKTPKQLMRSRYAAFFHKNSDYLIATRDPDFREVNDRQALATTFDNTRWLGLVVIQTDDSQLEQGIGSVEFAAFYDGGHLHEKSLFVNREGRWYYCEGQMLPPLVWGRNQLCWCNSQKKYKKCHGK